MKEINKEKRDELIQLGLPIKSCKYSEKGSMKYHFYVSFDRPVNEAHKYDLDAFAKILNDNGYVHTRSQPVFTRYSFNGGCGFYLYNK